MATKTTATVMVTTMSMIQLLETSLLVRVTSVQNAIFNYHVLPLDPDRLCYTLDSSWVGLGPDWTSPGMACPPVAAWHRDPGGNTAVLGCHRHAPDRRRWRSWCQWKQSPPVLRIKMYQILDMPILKNSVMIYWIVLCSSQSPPVLIVSDIEKCCYIE